MTALSAPLSSLILGLLAGESKKIVTVGDSTCEGTGDEFRSTLFGWPGRFGKSIGDITNCNVDVYDWQRVVNSGIIGGSPTYTGPFSVRDSEVEGAPTLTIKNAGIATAVMPVSS